MTFSLPPDLPRLPPRPADSHKGDFGRVLLAGGSTGMAGAVSLAGLAALRSGAGLVTLAVPEAILPTVASFSPVYMTVPLPCDPAGRVTAAALAILGERFASATCGAIGPGWGRSPGVSYLASSLYASLPIPLVCDADALNALAETKSDLASHAGPRILTPHPGEFQRLSGVPASDRPAQEAAAISLARSGGLVIVLKGHRSLITDGSLSFYNPTGNPGLAKGGSGDVLTGIIAALVAQGLPPLPAARLAVFIHGLAGDLAAEKLGPIGMTPLDLIDFLPAAWHRTTAATP